MLFAAKDSARFELNALKVQLPLEAYLDEIWRRRDEDQGAAGVKSNPLFVPVTRVSDTMDIPARVKVEKLPTRLRSVKP